MTKLVYLLVVLISVLLSPLVRGADDEDRERRVRVAMALAQSQALAKKNAATKSLPAVAPPPRVAKSKSYKEGHQTATAEQKPLVVYVSFRGPSVSGADTCHTTASEFGDVKGPATVVLVPKGDRLYVDKVLPGSVVDAEAVKSAVDAAAKKIEGPLPKSLSPAPQPLNTQIYNPRPLWPSAYPPNCTGRV